MKFGNFDIENFDLDNLLHNVENTKFKEDSENKESKDGEFDIDPFYIDYLSADFKGLKIFVGFDKNKNDLMSINLYLDEVIDLHFTIVEGNAYAKFQHHKKRIKDEQN